MISGSEVNPLPVSRAHARKIFMFEGVRVP